MIRFLNLLILIICFGCSPSKAQLIKASDNIDSLQNELKKHHRDSTIIKIECELAIAYLQKDEETSLRYVRQAIERAKITANTKYLGHAYYYLGFIYQSFGDFRKSIAATDTALEIFAEMNYQKGTAEALSVYGLSNWRLGLNDKSLIAFNRILNMPNKTELAQTKLAATINTALIYEEQLRNDKAEQQYKVGLKMAKEQSDLYGQLICYNNLSSLARFKKNFEESVALSHKAIFLATRINNKREQLRAESNLGATYIQMQQWDSAEYYLLKSLAVGVDVNNKAHLVKATWHLSELYIHRGKYELAKKYAKQSIQLSRESNILEDLAYGYEALFDIAKKQQQYALAVQMADSLIYWKDSIYKSTNLAALANAEVSYNNKILLKENQRLDAQRAYLHNLMLGSAVLIALFVFAAWTFYKRKSAQKKLDIEMKSSQILMENMEAYRKKRALELHDDVGQDLLLAQQSIQLNSTKKQTKEFIERALQKVRKISKDEYPYELSYIGLKASLEHLIDLIEQNADLIISDSMKDLPRKLPAEKNLNIYRIIQELLNNSIKNPTTTAVFIGMDTQDNVLEIIYKDNGAGFSFDKQLIQSESVGLKSIVNRVRILQGILKKVPSETENMYRIQIPLHD